MLTGTREHNLSIQLLKALTSRDNLATFHFNNFWPTLHYTTTLVFWMYIFGLKDSGKCSSLHYTTTWVFWMHILKLKRSVGRCLLVGQVYTTPLHQFLECTYLIWSPQAVGLAYTTPLHWIFAYIYSNWKGLWKEVRWLANLTLHHYIGFSNVYIRFEGLWQPLKLTLHHYMVF